MESPITKLRATEMMLEETKNKLASIEEELNDAKEKIKTLKSDAEKDSEKEEKSLSHYLRKEARIITEVQEILANEIKARLSQENQMCAIVQLVEPLAKLRIKG
ncbi:hypothetical protein [Mogibacterium timidum]|uniref:hypothetical protein n=1 Tax=Mogibacterium timidum TaxID=35519 RepID=UPI00248C2E43|nr:hypothetical protein [Mogibacterium timidum]